MSAVLDYNLAATVMRGATEFEVNDVFDRINTYGHRLSEQERRQAGVQNDFSNMVRLIACTLRGDESADILPLRLMPSISVDLPMTKHGYAVQADEVFWVVQGVLRSTDLRDSMDEQCVADIAACIVGGKLIDRSKEALDEIYFKGTPESERILSALEVYGANRFSDEFKYCVDQVLKVCAAEGDAKLRDLVFEKKTSNAFPSIFAAILIAIHELVVIGGKIIVDYDGVKSALTNLSGRIEKGRKGTTPLERRRNIDTIKGLIQGCFVLAHEKPKIYGSDTATDIESSIRRSELELSDYELKQGLLKLSADRGIDPDMISKVVKTICAIANNGPGRVGKIIIGVTDKPEDALRVKELDGIEPRKVGRRFVVGVAREARALGISLDDYYSKLRDGIKNSELSQPLGPRLITTT